jgi:glutathione S-transferase
MAESHTPKSTGAAPTPSPDGSTRREFIATDRLSVADITAVVAVDFARIVKRKPDEAKHPELIRWRAGLAKRPSMAL